MCAVKPKSQTSQRIVVGLTPVVSSSRQYLRVIYAEDRTRLNRRRGKAPVRAWVTGRRAKKLGSSKCESKTKADSGASPQETWETLTDD